MATKNTGKLISSKQTQASGSLNRAVLLINAIARGSRKGSLLTELVARTGLPRPTIHRVLNMLTGFGWVERDEATTRFNLGKDFVALGYSAIIRYPLERIAAPQLSILSEEINQVVYLGVRSGLDMVCIGRYESLSQIMVGRGYVGMRGPLGMTPSCMAMLSAMPVDEVQEIVKANMSRFHRIAGFDETGFHRTLERSIKVGYGTYDNIVLDRTTSGLGVPILDDTGYPIAAIGTTFITGWLSDEQQQNCLEKLQSAALAISQKLFEKKLAAQYDAN